MTLTQKKKQKIIDLGTKDTPIDIIALATNTRRNTVKKYLREYGLLGYQPYGNPPLPLSKHVGLPSLCYSSPGSTIEIDNQKQKVTQQAYENEIAYELEGNLTRELNKRNQENEMLTQRITQLESDRENTIAQERIWTKENEDLKLRITQLTNGLETATEQVRTLKTENENITKENTRMRHDLDNANNGLKGVIQTYQGELVESKKKLLTVYALHNEYQVKKEEEIQKRDDDVKGLENALSCSNKKAREITAERDKLKNQVKMLEEKQLNAWKYNVLSFLGGVGTGIGGLVIYQNITSPLPQRIEPGNNVRYGIPITGTMEINSGFQCSGAIITNNGETTPTVYNALPNQQSMIPAIQPIDNGVTKVTNISGPV